ncbi:YbjN domain-containing protein [Sanguibacter sp. 25GB23B1]|uniref:YbjN domain-containing protein n=1 Tax=unclassified Sanguibacter TaxID=2645534 RepID=UPI0032AF6E5F
MTDQTVTDQPTIRTQGPGAGTTTLDAVIAALTADGRTLDVDQDLETFDVAPLVAGGEPVLGVVMTTGPAVVFYAVRSELVPAAARGAVAEWATRENTRLSTSAVELDLERGMLSLRSGVRLPDVPVSFDVLRSLLRGALAEVESVSLRTGPAAEEVIASALEGAAAAETSAEDAR